MHHLHGPQVLRHAAAVRARELLPGMRPEACRVPRVPGAHHSQAEVLYVRDGVRHTVLKVKNMFVFV